jgi:hypothetical protein
VVDEHPNIAPLMEAYAQDCVDHAKAMTNVDLDYSVESLKVIEAILAAAHEQIPRGPASEGARTGPSQESLATISKGYGGYIGEVIRRRHGGSWEINTGLLPQPAIALRVNESVIFPPQRVYNRLTNGPEDNVWDYYRVLARQWPALPGLPAANADVELTPVPLPNKY